MRFPTPLVPAVLLRRYKRFLADVEYSDGTRETVHCPNPGAMTGLDAPGASVFVSVSPNKKRKLPRTLELVEADGVWVGINTGLPNRLAAEAIEQGRIPELACYPDLRREVTYGQASRIDLLLSGKPDDGRPCYVEIKNVHLSRAPGLAEFPDSVTSRGAKHLRELSAQVDQGNRAVMFFVIQRADGGLFRLARDIDPAYGQAFDMARKRGVEMLAYACTVSPEAVTIDTPVPIDE